MRKNIGNCVRYNVLHNCVKTYNKQSLLSIRKAFIPPYTKYNLVFVVDRCSYRKHARFGMLLFENWDMSLEMCGNTQVGQTATLRLNPQEAAKCY